MSEIHQKAIAQFTERRAALEAIAIPEWDAVIYFRPAISARERAQIWQHNNPRTGWDQYAAILEAVLVRALDADGKRLFSNADRELLLDKYDPSVLERIAIEMGTFERESVNEKKS